MQTAHRSRHAFALGLGAFALAALTGSAGAQISAAQQNAVKSNCRSDFMANCSGVTPGTKDALTCLQTNVAKLSAGCQTAVRATLPKEPAQAATPPAAPAPPPAAAAAPSAPLPAATKKPASIVSAPPPKAQPAKRAAKKPAEPAAAAAQTTIPAAPAASAVSAQTGPTSSHQNAIRQNCRNDFMSKCQGVQPGGKEALACLQQNVEGLSPACKRVVSGTMRGPAAAAAAVPAAAPPAVAAPAQPAAAPAMVPGGLLVEKACARFILMHCRDAGFGPRAKVACMANYVKSGNDVGPRCRAALTATGQLH